MSDEEKKNFLFFMNFKMMLYQKDRREKDRDLIKRLIVDYLKLLKEEIKKEIEYNESHQITENTKFIITVKKKTMKILFSFLHYFYFSSY